MSVYAQLRCAAVLALLLVCTGARAEDCPAPDFKDSHFAKMHHMIKYAYLSKLSKNEFESNKETLKLDAVIPYLDVPIGIDYGTMKEQLRQMESLTQIQLEETHHKTLQDIKWTAMGLDGYKDCLRKKQPEGVYIDYLKGKDPFSEEIILNVTWLDARTPDNEAKISRVICIGALACTGINEGTKIKRGFGLPLTVKRAKATPLTVIVYVDGLPGEFHLPALPRKTEKRVVQWERQIVANVRVSDKLIQLPRIDTLCFPEDLSFELKEEEQFAIGTAKARLIGQGGSTSPTPGHAEAPIQRRGSSHKVCWQFSVVSDDISNGYYATYSGELTIVKPSK